MHLINKYSNVILVTFVVLSILVGDYFYTGSNVKDFFDFPNNIYKINYYLMFFGLYFFYYYYICPKYFSLKKIIYFIIISIILMFLFVLIRYVLDEIITYNILGFHNYGDKTRTLTYYTYDNLLFAFKSISYSSSLYFFLAYFKNINKIHQLKLDHKTAEINYLKSQISPHFLFNTLNTFYVELIDEKPETAKDIHKLSQLLRFVIYESQADFIPLENEIRFLNDYISFYYKRYENELFVDFIVDGRIANGKQIPSLILIHFIENVFKHGTINDKEHPAKIVLIIQENQLILQTKNKFVVSEKYTYKGIGSSNIERKLKAIYKTNFKLNYQTKNDYFSTYLKIPI